MIAISLFLETHTSNGFFNIEMLLDDDIQWKIINKLADDEFVS